MPNKSKYKHPNPRPTHMPGPRAQASPNRRPILYTGTGNKKHERMAIKKTGNNAATVSDGVSSEEDASTILLCSLSLSLSYSPKSIESTPRLVDSLMNSSPPLRL